VADGGGGARLARGLLRLARRYGLDGIDLDGEGPFRSQREYVGYLRWANRTARGLRKHGILASLALHPGQLAFPDLYDAVDRVHLMAYDMTPPAAEGAGAKDGRGGGHGDDDAYHGSFRLAREAVEKLVESGCPASKILLGIPAYARHSRDPAQVKTYVEMLAEAGADAAAATARGEPIDLDGFGEDFRGYRGESPGRVRRKAELARSLGLGGVFFWELGQDAPTKEAPGGVLLQAASEGRVHEGWRPDSPRDAEASDGGEL
jgi:GH18 family chitinase